MPPPPYPDATEDSLLSPKQVVRELTSRGMQISARTIARYFHQGLFPGAFQTQRLIWIPRAGLDHYLQHGVKRP